MKKQYRGSCHCGKVRFEADFDLSQGTGKCNCSFCAKARVWGVLVQAKDFRLVSGAEDLADYQFGGKTMHHTFCKHCGVRPFGRGHAEALGGDFYGVAVTCIDGLDPSELAQLPVMYVDGKNNNWQAAPSETRHL